MEYNIIGSVWFSPTQYSNYQPASIGIVLIKSDSRTNKAYIGLGKGLKQEEDEQIIAARGCPFPLEEAKKIIGGLN